MFKDAAAPEVVTKGIQQAIRVLIATKTDFKAILSNGEEYGNLEIVGKKKRTANPNRVFGDLVRHYDQYIDYDAVVGDVFEIPKGPFESDEIRRGVCSKLSKTWGNGTYTTAVLEDCVQVLRIA
jgi:hypothetical protein